MRLTRITSIILLSTVCLLFACKSGPKVIESEDDGSTTSDQIESNSGSALAQAASMNDEHHVTAKEVLDTDKYTYILVEENGEEFWIAVPLMDVKEGESFHYKGGLLKKNFRSREYDRVFETLYLVSDIRRANGASAIDEAMSQLGGGIDPDAPIQVEPKEGSVKLSELFANKEKYDGKSVQVTGKVVKVNPNIMGRNWIHLQDGTGDGLDLTITTSDVVPVGHVVTIQGVIALNKDFGAGYRYDIILEQGDLQ